jgi:hypothetical protein
MQKDQHHASAPKPKLESRRSRFLFGICAIGIGILSCTITDKVFLICLYGWTQVDQKNLYFIRPMYKGQPWRVSNGDVVGGASTYHLLIFMACGLILSICTYPLVRLIEWKLLCKTK